MLVIQHIRGMIHAPFKNPLFFGIKRMCKEKKNNLFYFLFVVDDNRTGLVIITEARLPTAIDAFKETNVSIEHS